MFKSTRTVGLPLGITSPGIVLDPFLELASPNWQVQDPRTS
jgi:hypothetical protein